MGGISVKGGGGNSTLSGAVAAINRGMQDGTLGALGFNAKANVTVSVVSGLTAHDAVGNVVSADGFNLQCSFEGGEFATLEWVDCSNHRMPLEPIGNTPPAEAEDHYDAWVESPAMAACLTNISLRQTRGCSAC